MELSEAELIAKQEAERDAVSRLVEETSDRLGQTADAKRALESCAGTCIRELNAQMGEAGRRVLEAGVETVSESKSEGDQAADVVREEADLMDAQKQLCADNARTIDAALRAIQNPTIAGALESFRREPEQGADKFGGLEADLTRFEEASRSQLNDRLKEAEGLAAKPPEFHG